jgi:hypothetical protein
MKATALTKGEEKKLGDLLDKVTKSGDEILKSGERYYYVRKERGSPHPSKISLC